VDESEEEVEEKEQEESDEEVSVVHIACNVCEGNSWSWKRGGNCRNRDKFVLVLFL
jgi:hypothetical protein